MHGTCGYVAHCLTRRRARVVKRGLLWLGCAQWTERLDYHFAVALLATSLLLGLLRCTPLARARTGAVVAAVVVVYGLLAAHVAYLNLVHFDYGQWTLKHSHTHTHTYTRTHTHTHTRTMRRVWCVVHGPRT